MAFFLTEKYSAPKPSRLFWICHGLGWSVFALIDVLASMIVGVDIYASILAVFLILSVNTITCLKLRELIYGKHLLTIPLNKAWVKLFFYALVLGLISATNIRVPMDLYLWATDSFINPVPYYFRLLINWLWFSSTLYIWGLIYVVVKYSNQLNEAKQASTELALELRNAQLNTLMAQLNPHFLFNALNNIRSLMLEDVTKSREMLTRLAEMLRYSLLSDSQEFETLENELAVVRAYLKLASIQYEERLNYIEEIDTRLLNCSIPPMLVQMLIENAVKYGIDQTASGGEVKLSIIPLPDIEKIMIHVSNPGDLHSQKLESTGLGVKNIKKRLKLLYGDEASFEIKQVDGNVIAEVKIPMEPSAGPTKSPGGLSV